MKLFTSIALALTVFACTPQQNQLDDNQAELFYMYSNEDGHYFLDPKADTENVIYVGHDDFYVPETHHGTKFVGTFADNTLWELTGLEEVQ